jgi:hypothetical protein
MVTEGVSGMGLGALETGAGGGAVSNLMREVVEPSRSSLLEIDPEMDAVLKIVTRKQFPFTASYACTDYRSQGQTIKNAIIDIALPPSGGITPFNIYVALSRCRGRSSIRLLRDFSEKILMSHPCEYLRLEDERLVILDKDTGTRIDSSEETASRS